VPVDGTPFDLRGGRPIRELTLDDAFGAVEFSGDRAAHRLTATDGRFVELWQDHEFGYVQVFTTSIFPRPDGLRRAIAVEPMTVPPNAFNTGQSLRWLQPGERWELGWGVRYSGDTTR
jgi:aldose 1-epimerase